MGERVGKEDAVVVGREGLCAEIAKRVNRLGDHKRLIGAGGLDGVVERVELASKLATAQRAQSLATFVDRKPAEFLLECLSVNAGGVAIASPGPVAQELVGVCFGIRMRPPLR